MLSQVYGYRNDHHYHKLIAQDCHTLTPCSKQAVVQHYPLWVQRLAKLAPMNEIQAKKLIFQMLQDGQYNMFKQLKNYEL